MSRRPGPYHKGNPFGCTNNQTDVMDEIVRTGSTEAAAKRLKMTRNCAQQHAKRARERMGVESRVHALIAWHAARAAQGTDLYTYAPAAPGAAQ